MINTFNFETAEYHQFITDNVDAKFYRYPDKIIVFTGIDVPPTDLDYRYCDLGLDGLRDELNSLGHNSDLIEIWLDKYL